MSGMMPTMRSLDAEPVLGDPGKAAQQGAHESDLVSCTAGVVACRSWQPVAGQGFDAQRVHTLVVQEHTACAGVDQPQAQSVCAPVSGLFLLARFSTSGPPASFSQGCWVGMEVLALATPPALHESRAHRVWP